MAQLQSGQDVTDLMNVKSGDDVTSLMNSSPEQNISLNSNEQPSKLRELVRGGYETLMKPLLPEADTSGSESLLGGGINIGENTPLIRNIWPGGIHVPGVKEIYNELIRPMSSPFGLGTAGLEGAIGAKGLLERPKDIPLSIFESPEIKSAETPKVLERPQPKLLEPARSIQLNEGTLNRPSIDKPNLGTGQPKELLHPNQLQPASEIIDHPSQFFTDGKASLDEINSKPKTEPIKIENESIIPPPGQAKPVSSNKDISAFTANFTSPDQTLASRAITKPISDVITKAQDQKMQWVASTERELADLSVGLNKNDRVMLGQLIDGQEIPNVSPDLQERASQARIILDAVHDMFPEGATKSGKDVGYLDNYFTHLQEQPDDIKSALKQIVDHHFGPLKSPGEIPDIEIENLGDMYERKLGNPSSPYIEPRGNSLRSIQYDVNKVFPAYIESAAKVIFDKPAIELAKEHLAKVPASNLKELGTWYIKNYANYDSLPGLHKAWNSWASTVARVTSRSLLGFNTGLQTLHLARIPANMWPELGTKYSSIGLKEVANHPIQAWTEAARLGLLQNEVRPFRFKTPMEKFDSISNFMSLADYLDKAIGYHGYKRMMLDRGADPEYASAEALKFTKRVSQTVDPARMMKGMSPESNVMGGEVASKLGWQFKQVPAKIVEQYMRIAQQYKNNPQMAARMVSGVGLALAANEGLRTFHLDPMHMIPSSAWGAFGSTVTKVAYALSRGNWEKALMDAALWAIPGGQSIKKQFEQGPSALTP